MTASHIMLGHAVHVRRLTAEDASYYDVDLGGHDIETCIAVFGEDMAECLAAVVDVGGPKDWPELIWSDADGTGSPILNTGEFAEALTTVLMAIIPQMFGEVTDENAR